MEIILFLIKRKVNSYFHPDNWKGILGDALYAILFLVYAVLAGFMYSEAKTDKAALLLKSVSFSLLLIPTIYKFFPSFSLKKVMVASQYPLSKTKKVTIDLLAFSLYRTIYLILLLVVFVFYFSAENLPPTELTALLLYWFAGILFAENFINALSWKKYQQVFLIILILISIYKIDYVQNEYVGNIILLFCTNVALFSLYFLYYPAKIVPHICKKKYKNKKRGYYIIVFRLFSSNRTFLLYLLLGSLIGILFPAMILVSPKVRLKIHSLESLFKVLPFFSVFFLPTILFTYIYNNLWGYFSILQINQLIIKPKVIDGAKLYLSLLVIPLFLNFVIMNIFLLFFHLLEMKIEFLFFISCFLFIPIGILSSFTKYFLVGNGYSFGRLGRRTSFTFILLLFLLSTVIGFFYPSQYYNLLITGVLVSGIALSFILSKKEKYFVNKLKNKMLNKRSF